VKRGTGLQKRRAAFRPVRGRGQRLPHSIFQLELITSHPHGQKWLFVIGCARDGLSVSRRANLWCSASGLIAATCGDVAFLLRRHDRAPLTALIVTGGCVAVQHRVSPGMHIRHRDRRGATARAPNHRRRGRPLPTPSRPRATAAPRASRADPPPPCGTPSPPPCAPSAPRTIREQRLGPVSDLAETMTSSNHPPCSVSKSWLRFGTGKPSVQCGLVCPSICPSTRMHPCLSGPVRAKYSYQKPRWRTPAG
jgi:hypothetical protein